MAILAQETYGLLGSAGPDMVNCPYLLPAGVGQPLLEDLGSDDPTDPRWPHPGRIEQAP